MAAGTAASNVLRATGPFVQGVVAASASPSRLPPLHIPCRSRSPLEPMRVLLVEDNFKLIRSLVAGLSQAGMVVDPVSDGLHADQMLRSEDYDAVVLDLALPRLDGFEVLQRARARGADVPMLILSASGELPDRVRGLNAGADDYLPKPFELAELVARLRALARRRVGRAQAVFRIGRLTCDTVGRVFAVDGATLSLTPREQGVLEALVMQAGRPVAKARLSDRLCTLEEALSLQAVEIYVHRLRRKLEGSGIRIRTLRGLGYLLERLEDEPA
jgi:two-component system response regulator TctD